MPCVRWVIMKFLLLIIHLLRIDPSEYYTIAHDFLADDII